MKGDANEKLKALSSSTKAFNKDVEDLQIKLKTLDRRQDDLADCRKRVKEFHKEFDETRSALSKMELEEG